MLSERLRFFVTGEIRFSVHGGFLPLFLSLCRQSNISLQHTQVHEQELFGVIRLQDFEKLVSAAENSGMLLQIHKKKGLAFLLRRYRLRWGIPVGLALGLLLLGILSSMVWQVQVNGCENLSEEFIREYFEEMGVRPGVFQTSIDIINCRDRAVLEIKELLWVSVFLKGCTACIEIRERDGEVQLSEKGSSNLIASYGGEIIRADVYAGESYVKTGQAVAKGDILVGGGVPLKNGGVRFVRSKADIVARTHRSLAVSVAVRESVQVLKKEDIRYCLYWFGLRIPLGFAFGKQISECTQLYAQANDVVLPIGLWRQGCRRAVEDTIERSERLALLQAFAEYACTEISAMQGKDILQRTLRVSTADGAVSVNGAYVCTEDICFETQLEIEDGK